MRWATRRRKEEEEGIYAQMGFMEITVYFPKLKLLHIDELSTNYYCHIALQIRVI